MRMANPVSGEDEAALRRLLVVDDEEIVLVALRETLMRSGYEVMATSDAAEALAALRTTKFAVIITDQQMPRMTGLEFLAQAKVLRPETTRILITAVLNLGTVIEAINQGEIYRFIVKPWLREEFLGAVASAVERYRLVSGHAALRVQAEEAVRQRTVLEEQVRALTLEIDRRESQRDEAHRRAYAERDRARSLAGEVLGRFDAELGRRTRRVVEVCRAMGDVARLSESDRAALEDAGWMHDLGCLGLERSLVSLGHPSGAVAKMRGPDREAWQRHARWGGEIAEALGMGVGVRAAIETHHERWDGSGYPAGLSGDSIPWIGRLLAVAVAFVEAGDPAEQALAFVLHRKGTAFDAKAVDCLQKALATR